jgi:hypothetical protein
MNLLQHAPIIWKAQNKLGLKRCPIYNYKQPDNCSAAQDETGAVGFVYCRRPSLNQTGLVGKPGRDGGATFILNPLQPSIPSGLGLSLRNPSPRRRAPTRITSATSTRTCSVGSPCVKATGRSCYCGGCWTPR